jgi:pyrroloquinoline quinone (PQQ) biosynthesis protein C
LVDQWYTAHHSVALLPVAIERYESMRRPELARFARHKLEEEAGHDRLPLNDLRALGYDPEAAIKEVPPGPTALSLVRFARDCVHGPEPVSFLGYIYMLERRVIRITDDALQELDRVLPGGVQATSGVGAHAGELDHQHVEELVAFVSGLPADDRTAVALACFETASLFSEAAPAGSDHSDLDREHRLERARTPTIQAMQPRSK